MKSSFPLWTSALVFAGLAAALVLLPNDASGGGGPMRALDVRLFVGWAHVVVLGALFILRRFALRFEGPHEVPAHPIARVAWGQYQAGLDALVLHWVLLYAVLVVAWSQPAGAVPFESTPGGRAAMAAVEVLNAAGGLIYFYLFFVLDRPTVRRDRAPEEGDRFHQAWLSVLAVVSLAAFASAYARLGGIADESLREVARHGSPVVCAIGMMYLFARFDRATMGVPPLAVAPLWAYVALQATWARASGPQDLVATSVFVLAFALKLYFLGAQLLWARGGRIQRRLDACAEG